MTVQLTASLGDLVTADPRRARILETYGLDYCCGGGLSLSEAAAQAGLDAQSIATALDLPGEAQPMTWQSSDLSGLAHEIVDLHHSYLWDEMPRLEALVTKVRDVHSAAHPELIQVHSTFQQLVAELDEHLTHEERVVFPAISRLERTQQPVVARDQPLAALIQQLIDEHDVAGQLLVQINTLTQGFATPQDACTSYRMMLTGLHEMETDLHLHIHKENNVLFPKVLALAEQVVSQSD